MPKIAYYDRLPRLSSFELNYSYKPYVGKKHYYTWATVHETFREKWVTKTNIFLVIKLQLDGLI